MVGELDREGQPFSAGSSSEQCLLLIDSPSDRAVHDAFRAIAARDPRAVSGEHLWIEGDVPLTAGLTTQAVPRTLARLLEADCEMIDRLELEIGPLQIRYLRSGGHEPFRESFYDEIHLDVQEACNEAAVSEIVREICERLSVVSHSGTPLFDRALAMSAYRQPTQTDAAPDRERSD